MHSLQRFASRVSHVVITHSNSFFFYYCIIFKNSLWTYRLPLCISLVTSTLSIMFQPYLTWLKNHFPICIKGKNLCKVTIMLFKPWHSCEDPITHWGYLKCQWDRAGQRSWRISQGCTESQPSSEKSLQILKTPSKMYAKAPSDGRTKVAGI